MVLENGKEESEGAVDPEDDTEGYHQPWSGFRHAIGVCARDEGRQCQEEGRNEQRFGRVVEGEAEGSRKEDEACEEKASQEDKDSQAKNEDDGPNRVEPGEAMRRDGQQQRDTSRGHGEREPSPCEVMKPFAQGYAASLALGELHLYLDGLVPGTPVAKELTIRIASIRDSSYSCSTSSTGDPSSVLRHDKMPFPLA